MEKRPIPWAKAINSGLSLGLPILISIWLGRLSWGLVACFGGFAYLYAGLGAYSRRAVRLLIATVSMALAYGAGALSATHSLWMAGLVLGVIGVVGSFLFEVFGVTLPSAFFVIFACAVGTNMPGAPSEILLRMGLILLGSLPAWLLALGGWLWDPLGPQREAVTAAFRALAALVAAVGTEGFHKAQHQATLALLSAEDALGRPPLHWRRPAPYERLRRLTGQADAIFLATTLLVAEQNEPVDPRLAAAVRALADAVADPELAALLVIPAPPQPSEAQAHLCGELSRAVSLAAGPLLVLPAEVPERRSFRAVLAGALDKRSAVLPRAMRIGLTVMIAHLTGLAVGAHSPYWVTISCAAVMLGVGVAATIERVVQRMLGTLLGSLLGVLALRLHLAGSALALVLMVAQALMQVCLVLNYALAITFATPFAFILVGAGHPSWSVGYLVSARVVDTLLGSLLGLGGAVLLWRRGATNQLLAGLSSTIRAVGALVAEQSGRERERLQGALIALRILYDAALVEEDSGESTVESLWPAVAALQRLGYLLMALPEGRRPEGSTAAELVGVLDRVADGLISGQGVLVGDLPVIAQYPAIQAELQALVEGVAVRASGGRPD